MTHRPHRDLASANSASPVGRQATVASRLWDRLGRWDWVRSPSGEQIPPFDVLGLIDLVAGEPLVQDALHRSGPSGCRCCRGRRRSRNRRRLSVTTPTTITARTTSVITLIINHAPMPHPPSPFIIATHLLLAARAGVRRQSRTSPGQVPPF